MVLAENLYPCIGGAEFSMLNIMKHLSRDHEVAGMCVGKEPKSMVSSSISCLNSNGDDEISIEMVEIPKSNLGKRMRIVKKNAGGGFAGTSVVRNWIDIRRRAKIYKSMIEDRVKEFSPDLVVTQLDFSYESIKLSKEIGAKSMMFLRDATFICPYDYYILANGQHCNGKCFSCSPGITAKAQYPWIRRYVKLLQKAIKMADVVVANSKWTASVAEKITNVKPEVIYPSINPVELIPDDWKPNDILFMSRGVPSKGIDLFLDVAVALPEYDFVVCGDHPENIVDRIDGMSNVEFKGWINRKFIFKTTKLVLVPSRIEPFGRLPIEAGCVGIPSIVSDVGGLPEAVGPRGVCIDPYDAKEWINTVEVVMKTDSVWKDLSINAKEHSKQYTTDLMLKSLDDIVKVMA